MQMNEMDIGKWLTDYTESATTEYALQGLHIELEVNAKDAIINADNVQLGNVLTNILENSMKYGDKATTIVHIACELDSANVVIAISDNGPGVPDEALDNLFRMFYRGDKARSNANNGSGLGLAISARIIDRFGGAIKVSNIQENGLSVVITLPVVKGGAGAEKDIDCRG